MCWVRRSGAGVGLQMRALSGKATSVGGIVGAVRTRIGVVLVARKLILNVADETHVDD